MEQWIQKRVWEKIVENILIYKFGGQKRNADMSWKNNLQKHDKSKGIDPGIYRSKPPFFNTVKYQFFIIFTMSIATLL